MDFGGDDRGVTVQIGAVLLFGFLVISLSMYQATVVPQENERVEFRHNQRAVSDMQEVRNGILRTASTGSSVPVSVELGTEYPARAMFVNPAPPGGTLSTSPLGSMSFRNVIVDDTTTAAGDYRDVADFWNETHEYPTKSLAYRPSYHELRNAPTTVYENGVLYNRFDRGNETVILPRTGQTLVSGERISVVTLTGNLSRGGSRALSVDPEVVSQSSRTVSVTNSSTGPLTIVVPTDLSESDWRKLLRDSGEMHDDGDGHVLAVSEGTSPGTVEITLEPGVTYQLSASRVRVGSGSEDSEAAYLTGVEGIDASLRAGERAAFAVEVRDEYNNPVSAPNTLNSSATDGRIRGPFADEPGRYRFVYEAPEEGGTETINVSYLSDPSSPSFDPERPENVQYTVRVYSDGSSGDEYVEGDGPLSVVEGSGLGKANHGSDSGVQFVLRNNGSSVAEITGVSVDSTTRSNVRQLYETNGGKGDGQYEVYFDVNDDGQNDPEANDGWYEAGDDNGDEYVLGSGIEPLTSDATLGADEETTVYFYEFQNNGGHGQDVGGHDVTVTVEYEIGGTTYAETFTVTATDPY